MDSRTTVRAALEHRDPGRTPVDFGGSAVTGMHVSVVAGLRRHYGLEEHPIRVIEPYQMLGEVEDDLKQVIGVDVEGVMARDTMFGFPVGDWKQWRMPDGLEVLVPGNFNTTVDDSGDILIYPEGDTSAPPSARMPEGGYFFDSIIRQEPIDEESLDPEDNLEEFGPIGGEDLEHFRAAARRASSTGRAVIANFGGTALGDIALVPAPFLRHPKGIRDITEWYMSTVTRPGYIRRIFEGQTEIALENLARIHEVVGDSIDVAFTCGTDFGTQSSLFCSPDTFRELYLPFYRQVNGWIHENTGWKTFKHSCGAVRELIPLLIEAGFDILNPVQCSAEGMDPAELKREYGDSIVFWGGGVDTQQTLPFGRPEEVRSQVLERLEIFSAGGGYVFNTIHNVQAKTPVPNLVAMIEAVAEFNGRGGKG